MFLIFLHAGVFDKIKRPSVKTLKALIYMVPEARLELARTQGPEDFESSASTNSATPA